MKHKKLQGKSKRNKKEPEAVVEENLDRFAGSSESEIDSELEEPLKVASPRSPKRLVARQFIDHDKGTEAEDEASEHDGGSGSSEDEVLTRHEKSRDKDHATSSDSEDDGDNDKSGKVAMASAMAKILGTSVKVGPTQSVVLAKTKTPIQKLAEAEKQKEKELKEKRKLNLERNLTALHIPLSVATSAHISSNKSGIAQELEQERTHRRVATRGVVALFNAIAQHQKKSTEAELDSKLRSDPKKYETEKLTKHKFLDMIKSKAASQSQSTNKDDDVSKAKKGWNALKDDYLLNPKDNWDQESSDEDENGALDELSDEEPVATKRNKRRRVTA